MTQLTAVEISRLLGIALLQKRRIGFAEILEAIARKTDSYGSIVWQVAPGHASPNESLFVLAQWFEDGDLCDLRNLPIGHSLSGKALMSNQAESASDIWVNDTVFKNDPFLSSAGIRSMCSVPFSFMDQARGTLNLYRRDPVEFQAADLSLLQEFAELLPQLYQTMRTQLSLDLVNRVSKIQHSMEFNSMGSLSLGLEVRPTIQKICDAAADALQCEEVSVFLRDSVDGSELFELIVTTWKDSPNKFSYRQDPNDGLTGWVLAHARPVKIYDLGRFEQEKDAIRQEYPGINWGDPFKLKTSMGPEAGSILFSFMAVPVMKGERVLGALRCNTARKGPGYFIDRDLELLSLLAAQIGDQWCEWLRRKQILKENKSWHDLVTSMDNLGIFVHSELSQRIPDIGHVIKKAVALTSSVISGFQISLQPFPSDNPNPGERKIAITHQDRSFGEVFIRPTGLPKHTDAETMFELLTQRVGQFCKEIEAVTAHRRTLENLTHELRSPIFQARARVENALASAPQDMRPALSAILGLCGKAKRVALNTEFFAHLDGDREPPFQPTLLRHKDFMRIVTEATEDKESLVEPNRQIRFRVEESSFEVLNRMEVFADAVLLEQAIRNLLDNAGKYSFKDTEVLIHGGSSDKTFHISVDNTGLKIPSNEVVFCTIRGWRSDKARWTTGEGSGIGLWLVEQIMKLHHGQLVITPTTSKGLTQVHLVLPCITYPRSSAHES